MNKEFVKLAAYRAALEKRSGIRRRLFNALIKNPTKVVAEALFDPILGISQAGTNAEIRRRTAKWLRNESKQLVIPAGNGKPAETIVSNGPEAIHLYHRPAAILHHMFKSGPNAELNRIAAGFGLTGVGGTLATQKIMQRIEDNRASSRRGLW